jgi:hypothetical protein
VVEANIQVKFLKTEVEKGFMRTAIDHELVDPKEKTNLENWINALKKRYKFDSYSERE